MMFSGRLRAVRLSLELNQLQTSNELGLDRRACRAPRSEAGLVSALALRACQCLVCCVEQREYVAGAGGKCRHADRDRDVGDFAVGSALLRDRLADSLGDMKCASTGGAGQHGDDTVVVKPGYDITGSDETTHRLGNAPDQPVHRAGAQQFLNSSQPVDRHAHER